MYWFNPEVMQLRHKLLPMENQSTESTAGRAYMQIYNGWQARIQVFGLEGAKFSQIQGGTWWGTRVRRSPEAPTIKQFLGLKSCIFMSILPSPVRTVATMKN